VKPKFYVLLKHDEIGLGKMFDKTPKSPFLTTEETAMIFDVTPGTVLAWGYKDKLRYVKFSPRIVRYYKENVARVLGFEELANKMRDTYKHIVTL